MPGADPLRPRAGAPRFPQPMSEPLKAVDVENRLARAPLRVAEIFPLLDIEWQDNELSLPIWDPVKLIGNARPGVSSGEAIAEIERIGDESRDLREADPPVEERRDRDLVGRVERARVGAASLSCLTGERKEREALGIRSLELELEARREVESRHGGGAPLGVRQRKRDRHAHVRVAEMGEHGAVAEAHERVDDRRRVHDDRVGERGQAPEASELRARQLLGQGDHAVQERVEPLQAVQIQLGQLRRSDLPGAQQRRQLGHGQEGQLLVRIRPPNPARFG